MLGVPGRGDPAGEEASQPGEGASVGDLEPSQDISSTEDHEPAWSGADVLLDAEPTRTGARFAALLGLLAVAGATAFVVAEMRPDLIFGRGVDVGGDNGGHIAAPYFLLHHLLGKGRLTGWDSWWFDGFPLYVFYFPLPALLVAILTLVAPYAVAFKIVTALGTVTLPVAGYIFGRLAGFRRPVPVLMSLALVPFLFNTSYTIDGGNVASTMAGEFSFSLAITTGLLFLGVVCYSLRTGRLRWLAAVLFAVTCVCHVIPALAFGAAAILLALATHHPRRLWRGLRILVPIGVVGALLAAWWLTPFAADLGYSSSMNYSPVGGPHWFSTNFLPKGYLFILLPAAAGALAAIVTRSRVAFVLAVAALGSVAAFDLLPSGLVYNARWLPFWFLFTALLAAYAVGEGARLMGRAAFPSFCACAAILLVTAGSLVGSVFLGGMEGSDFLGYSLPVGHTQVDGWVSWNYSGIQARSGWPVFKGIVRLLDRAGAAHGCGRLQYEYLSETLDPFGSTEEMMSIPMWTNGCMKTTDGIYFESSTTTPFHFLDVSEVSQDGEASDPVAGLDYPGFDLPDGIRHLQLMGVRYFLAMSPPVEAVAATDPDLVRIGSAPGFPGPYNGEQVTNPHVVLYLIRRSKLVTPLSHLPEVEQGASHDWLKTNLDWYESEQYWPVELARSGPSTWPRAKQGALVPPAGGVPTRKTKVTAIRTTDSSISFDVSRTGTPVLVKVPYFPNWQPTGASGPYEVSPNLMAVVPSSHHVTLTYGTSGADWAGKGASLAGVVGLGALAAAKRPAPAIPATPEEPVSPVAERKRREEDEESSLLSVVLPAHNEEGLLEDTLHQLLTGLRGRRESFEIIVVENGSTDQTAAIARRLSESEAELRLVRLIEADYGDALRAGLLAARGTVVVLFDVDYFDLSFLDSAYQLISAQSCEIVLASKRAPGAADRRPFVRRLLTAWFTRMMRSLLGVPVSDAHGMKVLDKTALGEIVESCEMGGALFDVEMVARAHRAGISIKELPAMVREVRPPRTRVARRVAQSLVGLVRLRYLLGPPQRP